MTVALEEFTHWRIGVEARIARLEVVGDEQRDKSKQHEGFLGSMDTDLSNIQVEFRAQRGMLQALHLTQNGHSVALRKLETGQEELRMGQAQLRREMTEVRVGIGTIIGLLTPADSDEDAPN